MVDRSESIAVEMLARRKRQMSDHSLANSQPVVIEKSRGDPRIQRRLPYPGSILAERLVVWTIQSQTSFLDSAHNRLRAPIETPNFPQADFWPASLKVFAGA